MKQLVSRKGIFFLQDVPPPLCDDNSALVRVTHSLISVGSEVGSIDSQTGDTLLKRAVKQPGNALKVMDLIKQKGVFGAVKAIHEMQKKLGESPAAAPGYSCSGVVASVGKNIFDLKPGDHVACGGLGKASHAEVVSVPRNLIAKVPERVGLKEASSATIGAIALQGVRRADVRLGEYVAVIGMGLIGQLTAQMLNAAGCRAIGIDPVQEKLDLAKKNGCFQTVNPSQADPVRETLMYTNDRGADATIIAASSKSDEIVQQAMEMTRKKGTVVVVGAVGLGLKRQPFYRKEIDLRISCSYGPGRYDELYEEKGIDYPYAYVRWTENRNMQEYLRLMGDGKIDFPSIVSVEAAVERAPEIYEELRSPDNKYLGVIFTYNFDESLLEEPRRKTVSYRVEGKSATGKIRVGLIGAGGFAKDVHLPNLQSLSGLYDIRAISSRNGFNARETSEKFGARYAATDYRQVLGDPDIDMVLVATRHDLHARISKEAAIAGKAVFVEKPMSLNHEEIDDLVDVLKETKVPFMVGFNRRFSPFALRAREIIGAPLNPVMAFYRVNARHLPLDHWVHGSEGGGRIVGEACHMLDFFGFLTGSTVASVDVSSIDSKTESVIPGDNFLATLKYENGSVCTLLYTTQGADELGKEMVEIHFDGKTIVIDDFKGMEILGAGHPDIRPSGVDKGHRNELEQFAHTVKNGQPLPIPLESLLETTKTSFLIQRSIINT
jgi:predicted dehydrogenase/threonine dehydrogenase-like Zn-dependent dehydrogenase